MQARVCAFFLVGLFALACMASLAPSVWAQQGAECPNAQAVATLGPTSSDDRASFRTTTDRFRVSYEVNFEDDDPNRFKDFSVEITDRFGLVESDSADQDTETSFLVPEDAGTFEVLAEVEPNNGANYTVVVEQCGEAADDGGNGGGGGGPDDEQYGVDPPEEKEGVIVKTIPDKPLPNTGGIPPALGAVLLLGASLAASKILRN